MTVIKHCNKLPKETRGVHPKLNCTNSVQVDASLSCNGLGQMTSTGSFQHKITLILQHLSNAHFVDELIVVGKDAALNLI